MKMIQSRKIACVFLLLIVPLSQATDVRYCDKKGNYNVKVKGVEISPNPVARGAQANFSISASTVYAAAGPQFVSNMVGAVGFSRLLMGISLACEAISGGKLIIDVSYFGFHIHSETHDLCEETSCPVADGDFLVAHSQVLPGYTPPGSYSLTMKMYDDKKNQLTCIEFDFSIGFASSIADT